MVLGYGSGFEVEGSWLWVCGFFDSGVGAWALEPGRNQG